MTKKSTTLTFALLLACNTVFAGSGGSIYSFLGIGDIRYMPNVRAAGMGYAGYALSSPYAINNLSPATWGKIDLARVEASMLYEGFQSSTATSSRYLAKADVASAYLAFPLSTANGIVLAAGFTPYSKVDYNTYATGSYVTASDTMDYTMHYVGTGGISKGQLGLSYAPTHSISLGASINYLFGTMERSSTQTPVNSAYYYGTENEQATMSGPTATVAVLLDSLDGIAGFLKPFTFGLSFTTRGHLTSTTRYVYTYSSLADTSTESTDYLTVPASFGAGIACRATDRLVIAADYTTQGWGNMLYNGATPTGIRNSWRACFGIERLPAREERVPLLDRIAYRLGYTFESSY
jgi:hypothetical protein